MGIGSDFVINFDIFFVNLSADKVDINREDKVPLDKLQEYELVSISTALDFFKKPIEIMQWGVFEDIVNALGCEK